MNNLKMERIEKMKNDLLCNLLDCGTLDIKYLFSCMENIDININDIIDEARQLSNKIDINALLYVIAERKAFLIEEKIEEIDLSNLSDEEQETVEEHLQKITSYYLMDNIYINYIDSLYNTEYGVFDLELDIEDIIEEILFNIEEFTGIKIS